MSEPYDDYDGYLRANIKWFLSLAILLAAIATAAYFASQPTPPAVPRDSIPAQAQPGP